jgi:hypothetical protein
MQRDPHQGKCALTLIRQYFQMRPIRFVQWPTWEQWKDREEIVADTFINAV